MFAHNLIAFIKSLTSSLTTLIEIAKLFINTNERVSVYTESYINIKHVCMQTLFYS